MSSGIVRFAHEVLGFDLYPRQAAILEEIYRDNIRTAVLRLGRRSGKGRMAAVVATYEATVNSPAHLAAVPPGERISIVVVATSQAQARVVHKFIQSFLESPALAPLVVRDVEDEIELSNGISISTMPCSARSTRGQAVAVLIMDEVAWFVDGDGSPLAAEEVWQALAPATAQFPAGRVLVLSTPRWSTGWFAELCAQASSGTFPDMRAWHAPTEEMNPRIPASFLASERAKDPAAYRREYEAQFDAGIGAVFPEDLVRAAVAQRGDLPAVDGASYRIALDAAFTGDTFAALVGHREPAGRIVVDRVAGWRGTPAHPVLLGPTLDAVAELSRVYHHAPVVIDQYAAEPIRQGLAERGLAVLPRPWTNESKVEAVTALRQALYASLCELPAHRELVTELVTLEQRQLSSGRTRIAAPGRARDDYASALLAIVAELAAEESLAAIPFANGVWMCANEACQKDRYGFMWGPNRPCPRCGARAPATYDAPEPCTWVADVA